MDEKKKEVLADRTPDSRVPPIFEKVCALKWLGGHADCKRGQTGLPKVTEETNASVRTTRSVIMRYIPLVTYLFK